MLFNRNVYNAFLQEVRERPDALAIVFPEISFSYEKLNRLAMAFASKMNIAGVGANSTIMVQSSDPLVVLATLLATSRLGASIVQDNEGLLLPPELTVTHHFHTVEPERTPVAGSLLIDAEWSPALNTQQTQMAEDDPEKPWLYVYTSGTTGVPKFLALSQRMVCDRSKAVADEFLAGKTRFASVMPCNSRTFIARALAALLNGATIVDGKDFQFWHQAGVTMVSGSVVQMLGFFRTTVLNQRIPLAEVIGSRLLKSDAQKLLRSFVSVQDVFGASEANKVFANVSTLAPDGTTTTRGQMRDSAIEIVDIDGNLVAPGTNGILRIRNPYMAASYVGDPVASDDAFRDGWFYPGDVAAWGEAGTLQVLDRAGNILNIGGVKINAFIVDQVLRSAPGIRDSACFKNPKEGVPDELFAFVVFEEGCNRLQAIEIARQQCRAKLGPVLVPRVIRGVAGIPRGSDGLPDRKACAEFILELDKRKSG
jgi:acyl-coenzyme A synthetase/AMP-(fatty) acid ligase